MRRPTLPKFRRRFMTAGGDTETLKPNSNMENPTLIALTPQQAFDYVADAAKNIGIKLDISREQEYDPETGKISVCINVFANGTVVKMTGTTRFLVEGQSWEDEISKMLLDEERKLKLYFEPLMYAHVLMGNNDIPEDKNPLIECLRRLVPSLSKTNNNE